MTPETRVRQNPRTAWRSVDEQALLVAIDARKLHRLNGVGTRVWELADGRSIGEIAAAIEREYDVERAVALADTMAFATRLVELGVLDMVEA